MAVPNETLSAIVCGEMRMGGKAFGKFGFNSLRQKLARSVPQNLGERIGKLSRLAQGDNLIVLHGVSILLWMCGWLCHRHDTPLPLFRTVTNFAA
jgi:hypothetical protein